jgi:hypothetical protein
MPVSKAFFYVSCRVLSKGAVPPGSPLRAPIERDAPFQEASFTCLSKYPVKEPPSQFPQEISSLKVYLPRIDNNENNAVFNASP